MDGRRICAMPGCPRDKDDRHLMCAKHWRLVPEDLNLAVYRAWRNRRRDGAVTWLAAVRAAVAAVQAKEADRGGR